MIRAMDSMYAAIDANFNRAMEGLRVCEDVCRFALHDETLSRQAKEYRHALAALSRQWLKTDILSARDTVADPIKFFTTSELRSETSDGSSHESLFLRNIHRAIEAVRSLEECAKLENKNVSAFQSLRFNLYAFEKEAFCAITRTNVMRNFQNALYAILDPSFAGDDLVSAAHSLIIGGARIIQLRMKNASAKEFTAIAREIAPLCKKNNVVFIINDRADIALNVEADGVHLGQDDISVRDARRILGVGKIVGKSTHSLREAHEAADEYPDYIAIGPVFTTSSKYGSELAGIGIDEVCRVREAVSIPLVAIGGITSENIGTLIETGINCAVVMSALYRGDIAQNCRDFVEKLSLNNKS